ncbi:MAG: hypothetical protein ACC707_07310 [Thiohalomonadales bacterium]
MISDDKIKRQLHRPHLPSDLEDKIRANWRNQIAQEKTFWSRKKIAVTAMAFVLLPGIIMISGVFSIPISLSNSFSVPGIVTAAANDIIKDEQRQIGIVIPLHSLLNATDILPPPQSMVVKMTKICTVAGNKTTHIKIAGSQKGFVHLFIQRGQISTTFWRPRQGVFETMPWKIIQPRKNLSVLVLYTSDMDPINVDKLINTMFSA